MGRMFKCLFTKHANQLKLTATDGRVQALSHAKDEPLTFKVKLSQVEESSVELKVEFGAELYKVVYCAAIYSKTIAGLSRVGDRK